MPHRRLSTTSARSAASTTDSQICGKLRGIWTALQPLYRPLRIHASIGALQRLLPQFLLSPLAQRTRTLAQDTGFLLRVLPMLRLHARPVVLRGP